MIKCVTFLLNTFAVYSFFLSTMYFIMQFSRNTPDYSTVNRCNVTESMIDANTEWNADIFFLGLTDLFVWVYTLAYNLIRLFNRSHQNTSQYNNIVCVIFVDMIVILVWTFTAIGWLSYKCGYEYFISINIMDYSSWMNYCLLHYMTAALIWLIFLIFVIVLGIKKISYKCQRDDYDSLSFSS
jgi:hypothetical protein